MDRPYIFCHMMTAPEGKIMSSYTETPQRSARATYFTISPSEKCRFAIIRTVFPAE